jgi:alpha-galactosidase
MRRCVLLAALTILCVTAFAQVSNPRIAKLATSDTVLQFSAGPHAPQLISLSRHGQSSWNNTAAEAPPPYLTRGTERIPLAWRLVPTLIESDAHHITFIYESRQPHLRLRWEWTARAKFGPIEHRIVIQNLSGIEYWLPVPDSLHLDWRIAADATLQHLYIDKGAGSPTAIGTHLALIPVGYNWTGWSSTFSHPVAGHSPEIIPWNAVFTPQNQQAGWFAGIEFSGRTRLTLQRSQDQLRAFAGLDPEPGPALTRLPPGNSFETPTIFLGAFSGGPDGAGNELRPWVRAVLGSPRTWADPHYPLVVNNSWGAGMDINEPIANRMIADASSLGFEMFHLDAGWFRGPGDWYPNPGKFPHGLAAVADDAHRHNLRFGLWVDWSQAGVDTEPGALNMRDPKVRDWLVADVAPDWKPQDFKGQTIDLGVPAARDYAAREVNRIVSDNHLDMLEHDGYLVAQGCTRDGHPHAPPNKQHLNVEHYDGEDIVLSSNSTDVSYHAVRAYYSIYEQLRAQHPGLLLEICNDGGRMVDFGSAAHGDYFSITDSYDPLSNRRAFYDASYVLPPAMLETYVEKWPTPQPANFLYMLRSGMMGWVSVMQNTNDWTPAQHAAAQQAIALYKAKLRPLIRDAQLFHITPRPDGIHWDGVEYFDATRKEGVVYAFRGSASDEPQHRFVLAGLDPHQAWRMHFADASSPDTIASGSQLMQDGLQVTLPLPLSSELIFLSQK